MGLKLVILCILGLILIAIPGLSWADLALHQGDSGETSESIDAPSEGTETATSTREIILTYENSEIPIILPRSTWENSSSFAKLLTWWPEADHVPPDYASIERIVVHDTGCPPTSPTCNNDDVDQVSFIQSIYRYHAVTRGWGDIGYNYIIDRQGRIYEGRYGGNTVRAAHVYHDRNCDNFNPGSIGIELLGNYSGTPTPEIMQKSLERLVAWIAVTNDLDLTQDVTSKIWHNPRIDGYCDISTGAFTTTFTGPILVSHGDAEQGNSDKFDLSLININAIELAKEFENYVYKIPDDDAIYTIKDGIVSEYIEEPVGEVVPAEGNATSTEEIVEGNATSTEEIIGGSEEIAGEMVTSTEENVITETETEETIKILTITKNQLDVFLRSDAPVYADGKLLKPSSRSKFFYLEDGERRVVVSKTIFDKRGLDWNNLAIVSDRELGEYPLGGFLTYPEGTLLGEDNGKVYVVENSQRRHITSASLFETLKYTWSKILPVTEEELKVHSLAGPLYFPDGTLIRGLAPRVYLVEVAKRKPIGSAELFEVLGFEWDKILQLTDAELEEYTPGKFVSWPDGTLVRAENSLKVYLIENGEKRWITTAEEFMTQGYNWEDIKIVEDLEAESYTLGAIIGEEPAQEIIPPEDTTDENSDETSPPSDETSPNENPQDETEEPAEEPTEEPTGQEELNLGPLIKIAIYSAEIGNSFSIRADKPYDVYEYSATDDWTIDSSEPRISHGANEATSLILDDINKNYKFTSSEDDVIFELLSYEDHPSWKPSLNDNKFRSSIEVKYSEKSQKFWIINELPMEYYIRGVAEISNGAHPEYLKSLVVAARSYAFYHSNRGGKRAGEPFHLINTAYDQIYKGYGFEMRAYDPVEAVKATTGEVAKFNGEVIVSAYSSGAPGPTLSACNLWDGKFCDPAYDYLDGGIDDPEGAEYTYSSCGGANHCVGLDGAGSRRLAALGKTYEEILKWYYSGIVIEKLY